MRMKRFDRGGLTSRLAGLYEPTWYHIVSISEALTRHGELCDDPGSISVTVPLLVI
jgi:hypothetical protein